MSFVIKKIDASVECFSVEFNPFSKYYLSCGFEGLFKYTCKSWKVGKIFAYSCATESNEVL